ncbi:MAG: S41 family peptidase [Trueperaceae bacterium]
MTRFTHRPPGVRSALLALLLALLLGLSSAATAQAHESGTTPTSEQAAANLERFERAWRLVSERYWGLDRSGIDWQAVGEEYRPQALAAADDAALYALLERMYEELGDDHSVYVPPARVAEIAEAYGSLPCVALFAGLPPRAPALANALGPAARALPATVQLAQALPALEDEARMANVTFGLTAEGVGYLRVPDLASDGVSAAVRGAVNELSAAGAWSFVLDLRNNPGGRLITMMEVAGVFTSGFLWRTVTSWSFPLPYPAIGFTATDLPLAVLIDGNVHSAAEGLAGALQARGRAVVVGETSAGNVEALLPFCLRDGSQAWIATGVLAPVLGRTWEGQGVLPDVRVTSESAPEAAVQWLLDSRQEP